MDKLKQVHPLALPDDKGSTGGYTLYNIYYGLG